MTPTPALSSKNASHRPDIVDGADARAVHCGLCNWKTATFKHAYKGGGKWSCHHCGAHAYLSTVSRFGLVLIRIVLMGAAAFASLFGVKWAFEAYAPGMDQPYGLHIIPVLLFAALYVFVLERFIARNLPVTWRAAA